MIKGKRIFPPPTSKGYPYEVGEWVMAQGKDKASVGYVTEANYMVCTIRFFKHEEWTEIESGIERIEVASVDIPVPVSSILYKVDEDVAKNLLLLQGIEI